MYQGAIQSNELGQDPHKRRRRVWTAYYDTSLLKFSLLCNCFHSAQCQKESGRNPPTVFWWQLCKQFFGFLVVQVGVCFRGVQLLTVLSQYQRGCVIINHHPRCFALVSLWKRSGPPSFPSIFFTLWWIFRVARWFLHCIALNLAFHIICLEPSLNWRQTICLCRQTKNIFTWNFTPIYHRILAPIPPPPQTQSHTHALD